MTSKKLLEKKEPGVKLLVLLENMEWMLVSVLNSIRRKNQLEQCVTGLSRQRLGDKQRHGVHDSLGRILESYRRRAQNALDGVQRVRAHVKGEMIDRCDDVSKVRIRSSLERLGTLEQELRECIKYLSVNRTDNSNQVAPDGI